MSLLRIIGLIGALVSFWWIVILLRNHAEERFDVLLLAVVGIAMLFISLFPQLLNVPAEIFSLDNRERGRLFTLLIISSLTLWVVVIYEKTKNQQLNGAFDGLVRNLAAENFSNNNSIIDQNAIVVVIPVFNEEKNIDKVLLELPKECLGIPIVPLVVDDGSQDGTLKKCERLGVLTVHNIINRGGGAALRAGYDVALEASAKVIVTMDGDGQHQPSEIQDLIMPIINKQADLVIGSRILGNMENYSRLRFWGVVLFGRVISFLIGVKVTDPASGFRAFNPIVLTDCVQIQNQYHTAEMIIEAAKRNFHIMEVPIEIKKRLSGESKKGKDIKYAFMFIRTILKTWIR